MEEKFSNSSKNMIFFIDYEMDEGILFPSSPGLLPLLSILRKRGHRVDFITRKKELYEALKTTKYDVVAVSTCERKLINTIYLAEKIKELDSRVVLILGGPLVESFAPTLLKGPIDIVIGGEAEYSLPLVIEFLKRAPDNICLKRIYPKNNNTINTTFDRMHIKSIYSSPITKQMALALSKARFHRFIQKKGVEMELDIPLSNVFIKLNDNSQIHNTRRSHFQNFKDVKHQWELKHDTQMPFNCEECNIFMDYRPLEDELDSLWEFPWNDLKRNGWKQMQLYAQRGCMWGKCTFCSIKKCDIRRMSPGAVLSIIGKAQEAGIETISFSDDMFFQDKKWVEIILDGILDNGLQDILEFRIQTRISTRILEILPKLKRANFNQIQYGVETLNPKRVELYRKASNGSKYVTDIKTVVERTAKEGISPFLFMILTDPTSKLTDIGYEIFLISDFLERIYSSTGILPLLSYNLVTIPTTGSVLSNMFEYTENIIPMVYNVSKNSTECSIVNIKLPNEFKHFQETTNFLKLVDNKTREIYNSTSNLKSLEIFIDCLIESSCNLTENEQRIISDYCEKSRNKLQVLKSIMDADLKQHILLIKELQECANIQNIGKTMYLLDSKHLIRKFGSYYEGIEKFIMNLEDLIVVD